VVRCPTCQSFIASEEALCPACLIRAAAAARDDEPEIDEVIASAWRLCGVLDANQDGTIYLVERDDDGRGVQVGALHLSVHQVSMPGAAARVDAERRRLMALDHPAIMAVLDAGLTAAGQVFVVFEHARGRLLPAYLQARPRQAGDVEHLIDQVAAGLDYVHRADLAHGAVSPSAVLVIGDRHARRARLLNMGIKYLHAAAGLGAVPTAADDVVGLAALRASIRGRT